MEAALRSTSQASLQTVRSEARSVRLQSTPLVKSLRSYVSRSFLCAHCAGKGVWVHPVGPAVPLSPFHETVEENKSRKHCLTPGIRRESQGASISCKRPGAQWTLTGRSEPRPPWEQSNGKRDPLLHGPPHPVPRSRWTSERDPRPITQGPVL